MKQTRKLPVALTDEEINAKGRALAKNGEEIEELEAEKKTVTADIRSKIKTRKQIGRILSRQVASGFEDRQVEVDIKKDYAGGKVVTSRCDTGEIVEERDLTIEERQETMFRDPGDGKQPPSDVAFPKPKKEPKKPAKGNPFYEDIDEPAPSDGGDGK